MPPAGASRFGWTRRTAEMGSMRDGGLLIGWGVATGGYPTNQRPAEVRTHMTADGRVVLQSGSQHGGPGTHTVTTHVDAATGRIVNANVAEYLLPVNADMPGIDAILVANDARNSTHAAPRELANCLRRESRQPSPMRSTTRPASP